VELKGDYTVSGGKSQWRENIFLRISFLAETFSGISVNNTAYQAGRMPKITRAQGMGR